MAYQVVEKEGFGIDWQPVRYQAYAIGRFDTEAEALTAAKKYLTEVNCNNSLTKEEKRNGSEAFMMIKGKGCFMGTLDGKDWFLDYRQDIVGQLPNRTKGIIHTKGEIVTDPNYYELEGKSEVAVRHVPGT